MVDESHAPEVSLEFLKGAFPDRRERLNRPKFRKEMGVDVGDRWPVIMAGYVVNSLNRSPEEIRLTPYKPRSGDEFFPARYEDVEEASTPPPEPKP